MKFPYQAYRVFPSIEFPDGLLLRPEVPLRIVGPNGSETLLALVDTGADNTLLPRWTQEAVGAPVDVLQTTTVTGIAGQELAVVPGEVTLILEQGDEVIQWTTRVNFADEELSESAAILGHAGCLRYFRATFDGQLAEIEMTPTTDFTGAAQ